MNTNDRIKKIREHFCNGSNSKFAERLGITPQHSSNITQGKGSVGAKILDKILSAFPEVNPVWLKMGEGEMLKNNDTIEFPNDDFFLKYKDVWDSVSDVQREAIRAFSWMAFHEYKRKNPGSNFEYNSFRELSATFKMAIFFTNHYQNYMERDAIIRVGRDTKDMLIKDSKTKITIHSNMSDVIDNLSDIIEKYAHIYKKIKKISDSLEKVLNECNKTLKVETTKK